jgi:hypothetical protein
METLLIEDKKKEREVQERYIYIGGGKAVTLAAHGECAMCRHTASGQQQYHPYTPETRPSCPGLLQKDSNEILPVEDGSRCDWLSPKTHQITRAR